MLTKKEKHKKRKKRTRAKTNGGTKKRPRVSIFRSNRNLFVQLVDDKNSHTLLSCSTKDLKTKKKEGNKTETAYLVGEKLAEKASKKKIKEVVFDRSGYLYHGRVKALAQGLREGGLKF